MIKAIEINESTVYSINKNLNNWKAPGPDKSYNFFIKKLTAIHQPLYKAIVKAIRQPETIPENLFLGNTYLIPKGEPKEASHFRPITCMSNLYKILTNLIAQNIQSFIDAMKILSNLLESTSVKPLSLMYRMDFTSL